MKLNSITLDGITFYPITSSEESPVIEKCRRCAFKTRDCSLDITFMCLVFKCDYFTTKKKLAKKKTNKSNKQLLK